MTDVARSAETSLEALEARGIVQTAIISLLEERRRALGNQASLRAMGIGDMTLRLVRQMIRRGAEMPPDSSAAVVLGNVGEMLGGDPPGLAQQKVRLALFGVDGDPGSSLSAVSMGAVEAYQLRSHGPEPDIVITIGEAPASGEA